MKKYITPEIEIKEYSFEGFLGDMIVDGGAVSGFGNGENFGGDDPFGDDE